MRKKKKILWKRRYSELAPIQMCIINGNKPKPGCILVTSQKSKEKILNIFREKKLVWIKKWESQWHQISHINTKSGEIFSKIWGNGLSIYQSLPNQTIKWEDKIDIFKIWKKTQEVFIHTFSKDVLQKNETKTERNIAPRQK